jgi:lipoprotein-anchoring transpeptidase ErfK/SrfK
MRRIAILLTAIIAFAASMCTASAGLLVQIDKSSQRMLVQVHGRPTYLWPVSTGRGGFGTPAGRFRPQWMARSWFSTRYYGSPMPHSIFFHKGYAIHGTNHISRLGGPASHGCVRLHPGNAATLFALVQRFGMANTAILIEGATPGPAQRRATSAQAY